MLTLRRRSTRRAGARDPLRRAASPVARTGAWIEVRPPAWPIEEVTDALLAGGTWTGWRLPDRPELREGLPALTFQPPHPSTNAGAPHPMDNPPTDDHQQHSDEHAHHKADYKRRHVPRHGDHSSADRRRFRSSSRDGHADRLSRRGCGSGGGPRWRTPKFRHVPASGACSVRRTGRFLLRE